MTQVTAADIWQALDSVKDPEIPVISVVEMAIVRDVTVSDTGVTIVITPTFSGCPALHEIKQSIIDCVQELGVAHVSLETQLNPPWTSDWLDDNARQKLKGFGLAPPAVHGGEVFLVLDAPAACPYCDSNNTSLRNSWGPTACRMIYYCNSCQQPFEQFKPI